MATCFWISLASVTLLTYFSKSDSFRRRKAENLLILSTIIILSIALALLEFTLFPEAFGVELSLRASMFFFLFFFFFSHLRKVSPEEVYYHLVISSLGGLTLLSFLSTFQQLFWDSQCSITSEVLRVLATCLTSGVFLVSSLSWLAKIQSKIIGGNLNSTSSPKRYFSSDIVHFLKSTYKFRTLILIFFFNQAYMAGKSITFLSMNFFLQKGPQVPCLGLFQKDITVFSEVYFTPELDFIDMLDMLDYFMEFIFCYALPTVVALCIVSGELEVINERTEHRNDFREVMKSSFGSDIRGLTVEPFD